MKFFFPLGLLLVMFVAASCAQNSEESEEVGEAEETVEEVQGPYVSEAGRFSVEFPEGVGEPGTQVIPVTTAVGPVDMHTFMIDGRERAFFMAYSDYPEEVMALQQDTKVILDSGRAGAIANINGVLKKERDYTFMGYPAKEFYALGNQQDTNIYMRSNMILVGERLYQVVYMSFSEEALDGEEANDYIGSFNLLALPDGKEEEADTGKVQGE